MSVVQNNTISTNSITEVTSANGVTIDGLNVKDNAIVTDTNKYIAIKTGELNSIGFVKNNPFYVNFYVSTNNALASSSWTEMGGHNAGLNLGWTVQPSTGTAGSTNSNPFDVFDTGNGRFTPTISGYYYINVWFGFSEDLDAGNILQSVISRNGQTTTMDSNLVAYYRHRAGSGSANNEYWGMSGSVNLDTNDYVSAHVWHNYGSGRNINSGRFVAYYLGENL